MSGLTLKGSYSVNVAGYFAGAGAGKSFNPFDHIAGAQVSGGAGARVDNKGLGYSLPSPVIGWTWQIKGDQKQ